MNQNQCSVSESLRAYFDQEASHGKREDAIQKKTKELLSERFNPLGTENWIVGLSESDTNLLLMVRDSFVNEDPIKAATVLLHTVTKYWQQIARHYAEIEVDSAYCQKCYDTGCPSCDPDFGERE
jgi:hypothetical protein